MKPKLIRVLDTLEKTFGRVKAPKRMKASVMLIHSQCGYPASEEACAKGWQALEREVGTSLDAILKAPIAKLTRTLRAGGMVPELRAARVKQIAARIRAGADLTDRKTLKKLPTIGDPGADKILLFTRVEPVAAVPSNVTHVPLRIGFGKEQKSYAASYRSIQNVLDAELPSGFDDRIRAYQLLKRHGQELCKRSRPRCELCPLTRDCAYFSS